ncbi:hypothetical protein P154DRAFT_574196 [Amniculicola lignicola CBS 123094]|uniref:Retrotransposon Copia-like N-terminal domain-containing protein n=1 Tax=Amniculicola lignicola CBS 123094 TaxID=1392246 RepID=A0A6A5WL81_9PLEO|nr:hypothetical protein P154DRAFT_574196 [Amniculicola lignicola CBS 123094]
MSPRLPGVSVLQSDATGPQYSRWRRNVRSAFIIKDTWQLCDGSCPMPMPESGPSFFSPVASPNSQPSLLEERKAWAKKDRDVKLDLFLSVSDDIKLEVFDTAPPLPPPAMTAAQMLEALDDQFESFKFEDYHHVFCYFLNLHIDSFTSLEEFNTEFQIILDDMEDHGHPLNNFQACSAYFSKLRCTQNPWVAKKLKEWDALSTPPQLAELMKECPPWIIIRPLATKAHPASQNSSPESFTEDLVESPQSSSADEQDQDDDDTASTVSSTLEQEITVHASFEDLTEAFPVPKAQTAPTKAPTQAAAAAKPTPTNLSVPTRSSSKTPTPRMGSPPLNRPLPPLPNERSNIRSRSESPGPRKALEQHLVPPAPLAFRPMTPKSAPLQMSRSQSRSPSPKPHSPPQQYLPSPPLSRLEAERRPSTSHGPLTSESPLAGEPAKKTEIRDFSNFTRDTNTHTNTNSNITNTNNHIGNPLFRVDSTNSSIMSLPLQGTTLLPQSTYSPPQPSVSSFASHPLSKLSRSHSRQGSDMTLVGSTAPSTITSVEAGSDRGVIVGRNWAGNPTGRTSGETVGSSGSGTTVGGLGAGVGVVGHLSVWEDEKKTRKRSWSFKVPKLPLLLSTAIMLITDLTGQQDKLLPTDFPLHMHPEYPLCMTRILATCPK